MGQYQGDTLIFSYERRLRPFFWGLTFWISVFLGVFRIKYFCYVGFVDIVLGS